MKKFFIMLRYLPILIFTPLFKNNARLIMDINRWDKSKDSLNYKIASLLFTCKEFRNLFIYRNQSHKIFRRWIKLWYLPEKTLYIVTPDIGGGFYIQHGFATYISAQRIGENCSVNQQVTIGYNSDGKCPIIGKNCMITCGAKVLGGITIGDNTRIGANAVVIRDYKRGYGVLAGVPAKPVKESSKERLLELGLKLNEEDFD